MKQKRWRISTLTFIIVTILTVLIIQKIKTVKEENSKEDIRIGILQFVEHEALDASRQGFIDVISKSGLNVKIDYKNAQGDQSNCTLIANQFVAEDCDLIFAIATPAAQSVAAVTSKIPILVTAITNPVEANLVRSNQKPGTNVSGTSDLAPISKQIELITKLKPDAKNVGILYSSSEANSKFQSEIAVKEIEKSGLNVKEMTFSQVTEIQQTVESLAGRVDAIYTPTDNMVAANMELISKTAMEFGVPVICGEVNLISKGAAATFGVDYRQLGEISAEQAKQILTGENVPQNMPIQYLNESNLILNKNSIEKLNINIPAELIKTAEII